MKNIIKSILFILVTFNSYAQKEASVWVIPSGIKIDFNSQPPKVSLCYMYGGQGVSSISDIDGKLLFYATVGGAFTKNCTFMKNGYFIAGSNSTQTTLILPVPGNKFLYYIFNQLLSGLHFSMVDMRKENNQGDVILKNKLLMPNTDGSMTAVRHSDNKSIWLIVHGINNDTFYSFLITNKGISSPVVSKVGPNTNIAYLKASPDGKLLAQIPDISNNKLVFYSFNSLTGNVLRNFTLQNSSLLKRLAFSSNSSKIYISTESFSNPKFYNVYQYDLSIFDSVSVKNSESLLYTTTWGNYVRDMQLAINGNIYLSYGPYPPPYLAEISDANKSSCVFKMQGLALPTYSYFHLPFFLQSYFFIPDFDVKGLCLGDITKFKLNDTSGVDSVWWNFGDTASGSSNFSRQWNPQHYYIDTGVYNVSAFVFHGGKPDTTSREIRIAIYPKSSFSILSDSIQCLNGNSFKFVSHAQAFDGNYTLYWDFGNDSIDFYDTVFQQYIRPGTYKVKLTALSDFGCEHSDSHYVEVYAPSVDFGINDSNQCLFSNDFIFSADTNAQKQITSYSWVIEGDTINSTTVRKTFSDYGDYTIMHTAKYADGCRDTVYKTVHVHPMPKAAFEINDSAQCLRWNKFVFTNKSSIDTGTLSFQWQFHDSAGSGQKNPVMKYSLAANYNVKLMVTSGQGCKDSFEKQVSVYPDVHAAFSINNAQQCFNEQYFVLTDQSLITGDSLSKRIWIIGNDTTTQTDSSIRNPNFSISNKLSPKSFNTQLIAISSQGCTDTIAKSIDVFDSPKANFLTNDSSQCLLFNYFVFMNTSSVSSGSMSYKWDLGDGSSSTAIFLNKSYLYPGHYAVKLIAKSNKNCSDSITKTIFVNPMPKAAFSINNPAQCFNEQNIVLTDESTISGDSISTRIWHIGSNSYIQTDSAIRNPQFKIPNHLNPGTWNLKLVSITGNGCSDSITKPISIHPSPLAAFSLNDSSQCLDSNSFDFTNFSSISSGSLIYDWFFDHLHFSSKDITAYSFKNWGKFTVHLIVRSDQNCPDTAENTAYVFPNPTAAFIYLNNCLEDTMWFFDISASDSGIIQQWFWDFKNGKTSTLQNPFTIYYDSGYKSVKLVSTNDFGCSHDTTRFFRIESHISSPELERATVQNDNNILVEWKQPKEGIPMTYHLEKSYDNLNWSQILNTDNKTFKYLDQQALVDKMSYYYRVRSTDSCNFTGDYSNIAKTILLKADTAKQFNVLIWTPYELWPNGVESYDLQVKTILSNGNSTDFHTLIHIPHSEIAYPQSTFSRKDSISNDNAIEYCYRVVAFRYPDKLESVSNIVCLPADFRLFIPNAFTPNGDGLNDVFKPLGVFIQSFNMQIFTRWGELIFESNNMENGWDGTFNGKALSPDNYYFRITAKGTNGKWKFVSGTVLLLR